jgi:hypothetical protein
MNKVSATGSSWDRDSERGRFRGAILDIASTLLNRPKESLDGEDVRVYKRNRLAAYAAVIVSLLLAAGATIEAVRARRNANRAEAATELAERPQRSLHQLHWLSTPPLRTIAFQ